MGLEAARIPNGWAHASLEAVCQILDSRRIPLNNSERSQRIAGKSADDLYPYYGATGQVGVIDDFIFDGEHVLLGEDGAPFLDPFKVKSYLVDGKFWVNNHAHILKSAVPNKYLCHYLNQIDYSDYVTGTTRLKLTQNALKRIPVLVAPIAEQRRIVAKVEELFSELDKGIESLKTARAKLNIYHQAVLKHAFEGKLTAQWREENKDKLETPEQLLARIKQEREARYEQQLQEWEAAGEQGSKPKAPKAPPLLTAEELAELPELPEGWVWTRFGLLDIELKRGPFGSSITKSMFVPSGFKVYEQGNAIYRDASRGSYFINDEKYKELSAFTVSPGDFIVSCAGTVGRIFELPENAMAGVINQALMRVRINDMILSKRFFAKLFESAFFQRKVLSDAKGTAMVNLAGIKELNLVPVAICNMSEQKVIDELLDARLSEIDQCERAIATSFQQAEALRQSILKRAFSGQLIPQDPDDEPASILLERIKAEKAARSQNNTRAKRRGTTATA